MEQSILKSTKKMLQIGDDDTSFDLDITIHINSAFSTLNDLGVGVSEGFAIEDDQPVWGDFSDDPVQLNRIKTFVFLNTRLVFDPPTTPFLLSATKEQLQEVTWRLSVKRESEDWVDPLAPVPSEQDIYGDLIVLDGGDAAP
jgi:hypothetical protein